MSDDDDYTTGYKRPPKEHQFQPGKSGNPDGRPKGSKNLTKLVDRELEKRVNIMQNGQRLRVSKREAIAIQLVNNAMQMEAKAIKALLPIMDDISAQEEAKETERIKNNMSAEDSMLLQRILGWQDTEVNDE